MRAEPEGQSMSVPAVSGQTISIALEPTPELGMDLSIKCQDYPQQRVDERSPDYQLGMMLSRLLKYGVWLATAMVLCGGVLYLIRHGMEPVNYQQFQSEPDMLRSPLGVIDAVKTGHRRGVIQLGLLFLVATPILRVLVSFIFFLKQRNFPYVVITGLVISGLLYSLLDAYL